MELKLPLLSCTTKPASPLIEPYGIEMASKKCYLPPQAPLIEPYGIEMFADKGVGEEAGVL